MAQIDVQKSEQNDTYEFQVTVREGDSQTRHQVTLTKADYERLTAGREPLTAGAAPPRS